MELPVQAKILRFVQDPGGQRYCAQMSLQRPGVVQSGKKALRRRVENRADMEGEEALFTLTTVKDHQTKKAMDAMRSEELAASSANCAADAAAKMCAAMCGTGMERFAKCFNLFAQCLWEVAEQCGRGWRDAWKTLRRPRIFLRVGQRSKTTVDQRGEDNSMQNEQFRNSCCSRVVRQFLLFVFNIDIAGFVSNKSSPRAK